MSDEIDPDENEALAADTEEPAKKRRLKIEKPNPLVYFMAAPAIIILVIYVILNNVLLSSDESHEAKIEKVLKVTEIVDVVDEETMLDSEKIKEEEKGMSNGEENESGMFDSHNYYQFEIPFAVNIKDTMRVVTFDLAISTFQSGITASFFFENFAAFVPAVRSAILKELGGYSLAEFEGSTAQLQLSNIIKTLINEKLVELGADPEVDSVLFVRYILT